MDKVVPIVERLDKDGYRIWCDEGIAPSEQFNDVIAKRISECKFIVIAVSNEYVNSYYCNMELRFAVNKKKQIIFIQIENDVQFTPFFEMIMANVQVIKKNDYENEEDLFKRLYFINDIKYCCKAMSTDLSSLSSEMVKVEYDNGDIYEGSLVCGKKNGYGKMFYSNGDIYDGEWKDDGRNGKGKMIYENGEVYEGEFRNGTRHGNGKMMYKDNEVYEGEFRSGTRNGQGKMIYQNGNIYEGEFRSGTRNGYGILYNSNGEVIYKGTWEKGKRRF